MIYNGVPMAERAPLTLEYGAFRDPPSALFRDYLAGAAAVRAFFDGATWDLDAVAAAAQRTLARSLDRRALAEILTRQQHARGAQRAAEIATRIAERDTAVVITGQQAMLFGGPLYVLYNALATLKLAAALEQRGGRAVLPIFWVASDDHDFAEVRSVALPDETGQVHNLRYSPAREPVGQPASHIVLDANIGALVEELGRTLPPSPNRESLVGQVAECYRPGATLAGAFACLLSWLLPDLVVLDPSDPPFKALMAPVMRRELTEGSPSSRLAAQLGEGLLAAGYHQQIPVRSGFLNLFLWAEGERRALATQDGQVEIRGLGRALPTSEAAAWLDREPALFSPGALLRPLAQDHALPVAAYVAGPAEVAYHAQIRPSYAHFGIPAPVVFPRPSLTLVEPAQARALEAEGLQLADLQADPEGLLARWARDAYPEVERAFGRTRESLARDMEAVEDSLAALDPTLRGAAESARGRALHQIEGLHEKALRALKKRDQVRTERLRRTRDVLFPGGSWQERGLGLVGPLARHGSALIDELRSRLDVWARGHQVIYL